MNGSGICMRRLPLVGIHTRNPLGKAVESIFVANKYWNASNISFSLISRHSSLVTHHTHNHSLKSHAYMHTALSPLTCINTSSVAECSC
eukprot:CAMPEP_0198116612 /NCGR_PEP_ID=MMETSP1442-20131203/13539_1 /TAXON_ID= /ORGANISM="Craspedostauros australis, Strain CCMP3328" /LENGTH=88 /DNA_ID=CAMNT_0043774479 /DNA_START=30 /DNA_END=293 /DNA_ORIENTATION=+